MECHQLFEREHSPRNFRGFNSSNCKEDCCNHGGDGIVITRAAKFET